MVATQLSFLPAPRVKTLADARSEVQALRVDGTTCPCCDQRVQVYHRRINRTMALQLAEFAVLSIEAGAAGEPYGWASVSGRMLRVGDFAKMAAWGLIEQKPKDDDDTTRRTSGIWRLTQKGHDYLLGRATVVEYLNFYNRDVLSEDGPQVGIAVALGAPFDFSEMMRSRPA